MTEPPRNALPAGYELEGYRFERVLGVGGFGITYLATEVAVRRQVAIKEYLPASVAVRDGTSVQPIATEAEDDFRYGLDRFADEGRTLVRFKHPNIVTVHRFFEANGTAYLVMEYERGQTVTELLRMGKTFSQQQLMDFLLPLLDGLAVVHGAGFLHRDIKPGNIIIHEDGTPVLIDFGAARHALGNRSQSFSAVITAGYSPYEQYSTRAELGPATDIYALGATLFRIVTDETPQEAPDRVLEDRMETARRAGRKRYDEALLTAIDWAMAVEPRSRPPDVAAWRRAILDRRAPASAPATAPARPPSPPKPTPPSPPEPSPQKQQQEKAPPKPASEVPHPPRKKERPKPRGKTARHVWYEILTDAPAALLFYAFFAVPVLLVTIAIWVAVYRLGGDFIARLSAFLVYDVAPAMPEYQDVIKTRAFQTEQIEITAAIASTISYGLYLLSGLADKLEVPILPLMVLFMTGLFFVLDYFDWDPARFDALFYLLF